MTKLCLHSAVDVVDFGAKVSVGLFALAREREREEEMYKAILYLKKRFTGL